MVHEKVYYINIKPYFYDYKFEYILDTIAKSNDLKFICDSNFKMNMQQIIRRHNYKTLLKSNDDLEIDKIVSKETIYHLKLFFCKNKMYSLKKKKYMNKNKTQKNDYLK
jgi:hypothetical protein